MYYCCGHNLPNPNLLANRRGRTAYGGKQTLAETLTFSLHSIICCAYLTPAVLVQRIQSDEFIWKK